jgi:hypothetical protein
MEELAGGGSQENLETGKWERTSSRLAGARTFLSAAVPEPRPASEKNLAALAFERC